MAVAMKVFRLSNPARKRKRRVTAKRNAKGRFVKASKSPRRKRRKASAPIRKRRKANPVARRRVKRTRRAPVVKRRRRTSAVRRKVKVTRRRRSNPVTLATLGFLGNPAPKKRRKLVARKKRRSTKRRVAAAPVRRRRRRMNPSRRVIIVRRKRSNGRRRRRSNPSVFGARLGSSGSMQMVLGGLLGVTAAKMIPTFLPASFLATPIMRIIATGASAWAASMVAGKLMAGSFADAVFFGGLMQTGSVALNTFVPSIGRQIGLAGMGDLVPGAFPVPQNPILAGIPAPSPKVNANMNGLSRAFPSAF